MSQVRFTLSRRQAVAAMEMIAKGAGAVRPELSREVLTRMARAAAKHRLQPLEAHDLAPSVAERIAEIAGPVRVPATSPEAVEREMARPRRADQPLSHAATMNRAGEGVTLQTGAEPQ